MNHFSLAGSTPILVSASVGRSVVLSPPAAIFRYTRGKKCSSASSLSKLGELPPSTSTSPEGWRTTMPEAVAFHFQVREKPGVPSQPHSFLWAYSTQQTRSLG